MITNMKKKKNKVTRILVYCFVFLGLLAGVAAVAAGLADDLSKLRNASIPAGTSSAYDHA